ncbi:hypothetical protein RFI_12302 [Reticulomyxa filosa]|uniref:Uncharacterized protein n=1 Tax=Reticulomyxa filosa TaxID=46433 RepID=X6NEV3_RETFI|nr:hypothetical protein RFI_12302 [Reticulomyxa filosa]|eukprot:ETO24855.1 hypothetical protein RFI_12302 [Reticulomyxa filosa]
MYKYNLLVTGCKPNQTSNNKNNTTSRTQFGGALQVYEMDIYEDRQGSERHDFAMTDSVQISDGVVSMDWQDDLLLVGTNESRVLCYNTQGDHTKISGNPIPFGHNEQKSMAYTPGSWMQSSRINSVKLQRIPNPDCFLTVKNEWFYAWNIRSPEEPINFERASTSPLYALEWQPKQAHIFIVGGVSKNLKVVDLRELSRDPSKAVPRVFRDAHDHVIRDIAWNPFLEYWIATCGDDGCVKIWDMRYDYAPVRVLRGHTNSVHTSEMLTRCYLNTKKQKKVRWSKSHAEMLITGSTDRTLMLWNLRVEPHFLLHTQPFAGSVVGCDFSSTKPLQYFGLSSEGDLRSVELKDRFVEPFVPHRYDESEMVSYVFIYFFLLEDKVTCQNTQTGTHVLGKPRIWYEKRFFKLNHKKKFIETMILYINI